METLAAFPDGEWDCIRRMLSIEDHDQHSPPFLGEEDSNIGIMQSMFFSLDHADNSNLHCNYSQESSHSSNFYYPDNVQAYNSHASIEGFCIMSNEQDPGFFVPSLTDIAMKEGVSFHNENWRRCDGSEKNADHSQVEPIIVPSQKQLQLKKKPEEDEINTNSSCANQKKRPRSSRDVQRCMKNARSKKNKKLEKIENEAQETTTNAGSDHGHVSSSYTSEDDNAVNQENSITPVFPNSNGKPRARRGSATDPQSLYARKRREKINERLRILQNLVPNGTKVDISTMLEEALHYVKFLQLQIKLLSSDDLWMYAPIAYNGLDIGLDLSNKISQPL